MREGGRKGGKEVERGERGERGTKGGEKEWEGGRKAKHAKV